MQFKLEFENAGFSGKGSGQSSKPFEQIKARMNNKLNSEKYMYISVVFIIYIKRNHQTRNRNSLTVYIQIAAGVSSRVKRVLCRTPVISRLISVRLKG